MKIVGLIVILVTALTGCQAIIPVSPVASELHDADFAYLLAHANIISESPVLHTGNSDYRIIGITKQGSCIGGCPPSTIYVATFNYQNFQDGHVRLCKIDGLRFYSNVQITEYNPAITDNVFLIFQVSSNPEPRESEVYEVRVSPNTCTVKFLGKKHDNT